MNPRRNNFDLIRLLAALQVVVGHGFLFFHVPWHIPLLDLFPGVPIFFCISGFLIAKSVERNQGRLKAYFEARILRIYPALVFCSTLWLALMFALGVFQGVPMVKVAVWYLSAALVGGASYNPEFFRHFGTGVWNGALWTVCIEITFYIFLPMVYLCDRFGRRVFNSLVAVLCLSSFALFIVFDGLHFGETKTHSAIDKIVWFSLVGNLWMLLFGTLIYRFFDQLRPILAGKVLLWLAAYLLLAFLQPVTSAGGSASPVIGAYLLVQRVILALLTVSAAYSFTSLSDLLLRGNDISYGIYIYHMLIFNLFVQYGLAKPQYFPIALAGALLCGALSWYFLESRMLKLKKTAPDTRAPNANAPIAVGGGTAA